MYFVNGLIHDLDPLFQGRQKWSKTTTRRAGLPPNRSARSSELYRGAVQAKPASYRNIKPLVVHPSMKSCNTAVRYVLEWAFLNEKLVTPISADNKCKLSIGTTPTVSRYIKARKTHILGNVPALPDHDPR